MIIVIIVIIIISITIIIIIISIIIIIIIIIINIVVRLTVLRHYVATPEGRVARQAAPEATTRELATYCGFLFQR